MFADRAVPGAGNGGLEWDWERGWECNAGYWECMGNWEAVFNMEIR